MRFKPPTAHNPLLGPAVCLCIECCKHIDKLRCTATDKQGRRCGDYKWHSKAEGHPLIVATVFQIVDERLGLADGK